jgi:hypothetical protein
VHEAPWYKVVWGLAKTVLTMAHPDLAQWGGFLCGCVVLVVPALPRAVVGVVPAACELAFPPDISRGRTMAAASTTAAPTTNGIRRFMPLPIGAASGG